MAETRRPRPVSLGSRAVPRPGQLSCLQVQLPDCLPPADTFYVVMARRHAPRDGAEGSAGELATEGGRDSRTWPGSFRRCGGSLQRRSCLPLILSERCSGRGPWKHEPM